MTYTHPTVINDLGGISVERADGVFEYLPPGTSLHTQAMEGAFGPLTPLHVSEPTPEDILTSQRDRMKCSRLQGRLVLGEATCQAIDAMAVDPNTPWAMRETILNAIEWSRTSQAMTELGYLLGYSDAEMDTLFIAAMQVDV